MRKLTADELKLVERLLNGDGDVPGAESLRAQLSGALVYPINDDDTILGSAYPRTLFPLKYRMDKIVRLRLMRPIQMGASSRFYFT